MAPTPTPTDTSMQDETFDPALWQAEPEFDSAGFGFIRNIVRTVTKVLGGGGGGGSAPPPDPNQAPVRIMNIVFEGRMLEGAAIRDITLPDNVFGDPESQAITYSISNLPPGLSFNPSTRVISGTPTAAFNGEVTLTGTDPHGASATETFRMVVNANQVPISNLQQFKQEIASADSNLIVGKTYEYDFPRNSFTDPEGSPISYHLSGLPPGMTIDSDSWQIKGAPSRTGQFTVTVRATDAHGKVATDSFVMTVVANQAPVLRNAETGIPDVSHNVGQDININLAGFFRDPDAVADDVITISTSRLPEGLDVLNGRLTGSTDVVGAHEITVYPYDGGARGDPVTFTLTVVQPNRAPEIGTPLATQTFEAGESIAIPVPTASFTDPDGDVLTLTASGLPQGLTLQAKRGGGYEIVGSTTAAAIHHVTITATDPSGARVFQMMQLSVEEPLPDFDDDVAAPPINGTAGNNILIGTSRGDTINGLAGNDSLYGRDGDDTLNGGAGNDRLYGDAGSDTLDGGIGNDRLYIDELDQVDGGAGRDTAFWRGAAGMNAVTVNSRSASVASGQQSLVRVEIVQGGRHRDIIRDLTNTGVEFYGGEGNDELHGGAGADYLQGAEGNDDLYGHAGNDLLRGYTGNDRLYGGNGDDRLYGDAGNDELRGGIGDDRLYGGTGADILIGGAGDDRLYIDQHDTQIEGGAGTDVVFWRGSVGANLAITGSSATSVGTGQQRIVGVEAVAGGSLRDVIRDLSNAGVEISGNGGNDEIRGGGGADRLFGDAGNDVIHGGGGKDRIFGGIGNDRLYGDSGADNLYGGDGADRLYGGAGEDLLSGQGGNDRLEGGAGRDTLFGGAGADTFVLQSDGNLRNTDVIRDFQRGSDKIEISGLSSIKAQRIDTDQDGQVDAMLLWAGSNPRSPTFYGIVLDHTLLSAADFVQTDGSAFSSVEIL